MRVSRFGVSDEMVSLIGEFSILWCAFENEFFSNDASAGEVQRWAENLPVTEDLLILCEKLRVASEKYLEIIDEYTIRHRLYSSQDKGNPERIELIWDYLKNSNEQAVVPGCFLFIQRIRNNLFHGLKDVYSLDKQKGMFQAICDVLDHTLKDI